MEILISPIDWIFGCTDICLTSKCNLIYFPALGYDVKRLIV